MCVYVCVCVCVCVRVCVCLCVCVCVCVCVPSVFATIVDVNVVVFRVKRFFDDGFSHAFAAHINVLIVLDHFGLGVR